MATIIILLVIVGIAGWLAWRRRYRRQASTPAIAPAGNPLEASALKAFAHGNTCLAEGKYAEASACFQQVLELKPGHPHVAGRLAEVERLQKAASATSSALSTC